MTAPAWIGQREAAEILGVHVSAVAKMVARGELSSCGARRQSLDRAAVLALHEARVAAANARVGAKAERYQEQHRKQPSEPAPPDGEHPWVLARGAAKLMGVTPTAISQRARRGRLPFVEYQGRRWFRIDLLALVKNADAARRRRAKSAELPATY